MNARTELTMSVLLFKNAVCYVSPPTVHTLFILTLTRSSRYVCIRGVFILTTECASLTVTLVVTLRKFLSLIFSILYFQNPFTQWHWLGTAVVFLGTVLYTEVWSCVAALRAPVKEKEKKVA